MNKTVFEIINKIKKGDVIYANIEHSKKDLPKQDNKKYNFKSISSKGIYKIELENDEKIKLTHPAGQETFIQIEEISDIKEVDEDTFKQALLRLKGQSVNTEKGNRQIKLNKYYLDLLKRYGEQNNLWQYKTSGKVSMQSAVSNVLRSYLRGSAPFVPETIKPELQEDINANIDTDIYDEYKDHCDIYGYTLKRRLELVIHSFLSSQLRETNEGFSPANRVDVS